MTGGWDKCHEEKCMKGELESDKEGRARGPILNRVQMEVSRGPSS